MRLSGGRDAALRARNALRALDGEAELNDDVRLLVTELVTNSFQHAGADADSQIELVVRSSPHGVRVEVDDGGEGFDPQLRRPTQDGGFGLLLVDALADRWGVDRTRPSRVWFEVDRRSRP